MTSNNKKKGKKIPDSKKGRRKNCYLRTKPSKVGDKSFGILKDEKRVIEVEGETCAICTKPATDHVGAPLCQEHAKIERAKDEARRIHNEEESLTKSGLVHKVASSGFPRDVAAKAVMELAYQEGWEFSANSHERIGGVPND